jgi:hypothetical protein
MKKISLIILLSLNIAIADCDATLKSCDAYVKELEGSNAKLVELVKEKDKEIAEVTDKQSPSTPWFMWFLTGMAAGVITRELVK